MYRHIYAKETVMNIISWIDKMDFVIFTVEKYALR